MGTFQNPALLLPLFLMLVLDGCANQQPVTERLAPGTVVIWPPAPEPARIGYVSQFSNARDLGIRGGALTWLQRLVFGNQQIALVRPMAVLRDGDKIYVADPGVYGVHRFDKARGRHTLIRRAKDAPLPSPVALALGRDGQVYVSDSVLGQILTIPADGDVATPLPVDSELHQPTGLAFDPVAGELLVADTAAHNIAVFDEQGHFLRSLGSRGDGDGEFNFPTLLWRDNNGRLYVTDSMNFRTQIFDTGGNFLGKFGRHGDGTGNMARQKGVATDSSGHIYVVDALFHAVQIFNPDGQYLLTVGMQGHGPGEFWLPAGIFIDAEDRLYIADAYNRRVQVFRYIGGAE